MLVWLASYPRSGNTFLRIVLHRMYGVRTGVIYDLDGVAERLGPELVGLQARTESLDAMRVATRLYLVKTHRQRDESVEDNDAAICLVRDGRDAVVSWARQVSEQPQRDFRNEVHEAISRDTPRGTGSWGRNVLSWLLPHAPHRVPVRYEDLVADPSTTIRQVVMELALPVQPLPGATVPSFETLHAIDPRFFRRGHAGTHRDELPEDLHRLFWSRPDNAEAMKMLGYRGSPFD
jgi:hypothetical protein